MNTETLKERIKKALQKIEKKQNSLNKKITQVEKKYTALGKLGVSNPSEMDIKEYVNSENIDDIYEIYCDVETLQDNIRSDKNEIAELKQKIEKYKKQLDAELEKENLLSDNIPEVFVKLQSDLVDNWNVWDKERRNDLKKVFRELGSRGAFKNGYTKADYEFKDRTDEQINSTNIRNAESLIIDLYNRVKDITGEVTDWKGIKASEGNNGFTVLNGIVNGVKGSAEIESILAGGYNIQKLHIRVLVKSL